MSKHGTEQPALTSETLRDRLKADRRSVAYEYFMSGAVLWHDLDRPHPDQPFTLSPAVHFDNEKIWQQLRALITPPSNKTYGLVEAITHRDERSIYLAKILPENSARTARASKVRVLSPGYTASSEDPGRWRSSITLLGREVEIEHEGEGVTEVIVAKDWTFQVPGGGVPDMMWAPAGNIVLQACFPHDYENLL